MKKMIANIVISALLMFVMACASGPANILEVQAGPAGVSSKHIEINDSMLSRTLTFGDVAVRPLGNGNAIQAQVLVSNTSARDVNFEYRFMWYEAKGFELSSATAWIPAVLAGKGTKSFTSTAPGPNAAGFRFMIRKPHPVTETGS